MKLKELRTRSPEAFEMWLEMMDGTCIDVGPNGNFFFEEDLSHVSITYTFNVRSGLWEEFLPEEDACPGCGCKPGDGVTATCFNMIGCGWAKEIHGWEEDASLPNTRLDPPISPSSETQEEG